VYIFIFSPFFLVFGVLMLASSILLQIQANEGVHTCASRLKVEGCTMASQAWVEERAIPLLR
jgi:hypothetical protein